MRKVTEKETPLVKDLENALLFAEALERFLKDNAREDNPQHDVRKATLLSTDLVTELAILNGL